MLKQGYEDALEDFRAARRKAVLEELLAKLTGKSNRMVPYDEIRVRLGGIETAKRTLQEIPLDSIIGTVSRYQDFNRKLLPLNASDSARWARVRTAVEDSTGLPPIEVYQIGDAYFILDGHHRASIARELGSSHIQAYVREVTTRVPFSHDDQPEDIILKEEYAGFLKQTRMDEIVPEADLRVSAPGGYEKIIDHISVHRYFQGIDENRPVPYNEAAKHWYRAVYLPVAKIIYQRNLLKDFPGRTEADLYLWIMEYRSTLEEDLGWKVSPTLVANDLISRYSPTILNIARRIGSRLASIFPAKTIEPSPTPGDWRKRRTISEEHGLFDQVLVTVTDDEAGWRAVDFGIQIAQKENAYLEGLHILSRKDEPGDSSEKTEKLTTEFNVRCHRENVDGALVVESGHVSQSILEKTAWADLLILRLSFPPPFLSLNRLKSGLRDIIRLCRIPLIAVPPASKSGINAVLLAYGGGRNADEALFVATYLTKRWNTRIVVVTIRRGRTLENELADKARKYLEGHEVANGLYICETGDPASTILKVCEEQNCDLILMGGYEGSYLREIVFGSTVDRVLWGAICPVMICH
jgi:nucleotide-binding universal stress UspA family protein